MNLPDYLLLFGGMALVTYVPRWLPLFYLAQRELPCWLTDWLSLIPVAIPTLLFARKTKSLGGTVLVGMGLYWAHGTLLG
jgi:branched-subunit amino acid transport protein